MSGEGRRGDLPQPLRRRGEPNGIGWGEIFISLIGFIGLIWLIGQIRLMAFHDNKKTIRPDCLVGYTLAQCEGWGMVILGKYSSDA